MWKVAVVACLSCDPWADEWFQFRVVLLNSSDDGVVVDVAEGCLYVNGKNGSSCVVVESGLC